MTNSDRPPTNRPDVAAFERDMRARFLNRETLAALFSLVTPELRPGQRTLVYILGQSNRIGHFIGELQALQTCYLSGFDRAVVVTGPLDRPGTNPWVPSCVDARIRVVHTDNEVILAMGHLDAGMKDLGPMTLLLRAPRGLYLDFFQAVAGGTAPARLGLPAELADRAAASLARLGLPGDRPFVALHLRTLGYLPEHQHHGHRFAGSAGYGAAVEALIAAGYAVVRIGEPGIDLGVSSANYLDLPAADAPDVRLLDLHVCNAAAFGLTQDSGPVWAMAAFGTRTVRTNLPFAPLNLPYNDDLNLFKKYRRQGETRFLRYAEILDLGLPALVRHGDIEERGIELVPNAPDEVFGATEEMLGLMSGSWTPDPTVQGRFRALSRAYQQRMLADPAIVADELAFYGFAHDVGAVSEVGVAAVPGFLD